MSAVLSRLAVVARALAGAATPANAAPPTKCDFSAEGLCGSVTVPLDRSHPSGAKIDIKYVLFKHTDASKPSLGTIFVTEGGPGDSASTTAARTATRTSSSRRSGTRATLC
jgi:hypothetical protein